MDGSATRTRALGAAVRRPAGRALACLAVAACVSLGLGTGDLGRATAAASAAEAAPTLPAQLTLGQNTQSIPRSFFGLSVEYNELADYEKDAAAFGQVLKLIRPQDGSRLELRIGGKSADRTFFVTKPTRPIPYGRPIGERWLKRLSKLVHADRLRVMLDLNLAVHAPSVAATFAQAAVKALPPHHARGSRDRQRARPLLAPAVSRQGAAPSDAQVDAEALDRELLAGRLSPRLRRVRACACQAGTEGPDRRPGDHLGQAAVAVRGRGPRPRGPELSRRSTGTHRRTAFRRRRRSTRRSRSCSTRTRRSASVTRSWPRPSSPTAGTRRCA